MKRSRGWIIAGIAGLTGTTLAACGSSDSRKHAKDPVTDAAADDGSANAAGGRRGTGGAAGAGGRVGAGGVATGGAPSTGGSAAEAGVPDAGAEAGDASTADATLDATVDAEPEAEAAAPPPPPIECVDGYPDLTPTCASVAPNVFYDSVAKTITVDTKGEYFLTTPEFYSESTVQVVYGPTVFEQSFSNEVALGPPQVSGTVLTFDVSNMPETVWTLYLDLERFRDRYGRPLRGPFRLTMEPPMADGGADAGSTLWPVSGCDVARGVWPEVYHLCSELGTATYSPATGEIALDTTLEGIAPYVYVTIVSGSVGDPVFSYDSGPMESADGKHYTLPIGADATARRIQIEFESVNGVCGLTYRGTETITLEPPAGVDAGVPAADAGAEAFWTSTACDYSKFFSPNN